MNFNASYYALILYFLNSSLFLVVVVLKLFSAVSTPINHNQQQAERAIMENSAATSEELEEKLDQKVVDWLGINEY